MFKMTKENASVFTATPSVFFFFLLFSRGLNFHPWYKKTSSSPSCVFNSSNLCSLQPFSPSELMWDTWGNAGWVEANHLSFEKEKKRKVSVRNFLITADSEVVTNDKESGHEAMKKASLAPMKISSSSSGIGHNPWVCTPKLGQWCL